MPIVSNLYLYELTGTKGPQTGDDVLPDKSTFYSIEQESLTPRVQLRPITISNGLVWSLNNTVLYYIDSPTQKVEAFDYDLMRGEISKLSVYTGVFLIYKVW